MPNVRNTSLKKYDISSHRFLQLYHHCLQYNEWKEELETKQDTLYSVSLAGTSGKGSYTDATQELAVRRAMLSRKCEVVEETAKEADADLYKYLLKAVTNEGVTYNYLRMDMNIPCGQNMYYDRRKRFYWLLDKKIE